MSIPNQSEMNSHQPQSLQQQQYPSDTAGPHTQVPHPATTWSSPAAVAHAAPDSGVQAPNLETSARPRATQRGLLITIASRMQLQEGQFSDLHKGKSQGDTDLVAIVPFESPTPKRRGVHFYSIARLAATQLRDKLKEKGAAYGKGHVTYEVTGVDKIKMIELIPDVEGPSLPTLEAYVSSPDDAAQAALKITRSLALEGEDVDITLLVKAQTPVEKHQLKSLVLVGFSPCVRSAASSASASASSSNSYVVMEGFKDMPKGLRTFVNTTLFMECRVNKCGVYMPPESTTPPILAVAYNPRYGHFSVPFARDHLVFHKDAAADPVPLLPDANTVFGQVCACAPLKIKAQTIYEVSVVTSAHHVELTLHCSQPFEPGSWVSCFPDEATRNFNASQEDPWWRELRLVNSSVFTALAVAGAGKGEVLPDMPPHQDVAALVAWSSELHDYGLARRKMTAPANHAKLRIRTKSKADVAKACTASRGISRFDPADLPSAGGDDGPDARRPPRTEDDLPGTEEDLFAWLRDEGFESRLETHHATVSHPLNYGLCLFTYGDPPSDPEKRDERLDAALHFIRTGVKQAQRDQRVVIPKAAAGEVVHWVVRTLTRVTSATYTCRGPNMPAGTPAWQEVPAARLVLDHYRAIRLFCHICLVNECRADLRTDRADLSTEKPPEDPESDDGYPG